MALSQEYERFLAEKAQLGAERGFEPLWLHDGLFDFQAALTEWAIRQGRCALFEDCAAAERVDTDGEQQPLFEAKG